MPSDITIRPATPDDLPTIAQLAYRIWPVCYGPIIPMEQVQAVLEAIYTPQALLNEMQEEGHQFWLAEKGEQAVGYCSAYQEENTAWLKKLYVLPELQGAGIGRQFIAMVEKTFAHCHTMRLLVNSDNTDAQHFYERYGFVVEAEVPVLMGPFAFTDIKMQKPLR